MSPGDLRFCPGLAELGVNVGRIQRGEIAATVGDPSACRVLIDVQPDGAFTVHSDADVQVLCRCAHLPDDRLV